MQSLEFPWYPHIIVDQLFLSQGRGRVTARNSSDRSPKLRIHSLAAGLGVATKDKLIARPRKHRICVGCLFETLVAIMILTRVQVSIIQSIVTRSIAPILRHSTKRPTMSTISSDRRVSKSMLRIRSVSFSNVL